MRKRLTLCLAICLLACAGAARAQAPIYMCVDGEGKRSFTNAPAEFPKRKCWKLKQKPPPKAEQLDTTPSAGVVGTGQYSCGRFIEAKSQDIAAQMDTYIQWAWGFIVAYDLRGNFGRQMRRNATGNIPSPPDGPTISLYLETHCKQHPLDTVMDGVIAMVNEMGGEIVWKKYTK